MTEGQRNAQEIAASSIGCTLVFEPVSPLYQPMAALAVLAGLNGKRFAVKMWVPESAGVAAAPSAKRKRSAAGGTAGAHGSGDVTVPMQGTIVKLLVEVGQAVEAGQGVVVLEAMKMENQINAEKAGTVAEIKVAVGDKVGGGVVVAVIS